MPFDTFYMVIWNLQKSHLCIYGNIRKYAYEIHMITLPCQSLCLVIFIIYKYKISKRVFMNNEYAKYYKDICPYHLKLSSSDVTGCLIIKCQKICQP